MTRRIRSPVCQGNAPMLKTVAAISAACVRGTPFGRPVVPEVRRIRLRSPSLTAACGSSLGASRDRKSTRLNSSHVRISYAVFCLKKKKTLAHEHHSSVLVLWHDGAIRRPHEDT